MNAKEHLLSYIREIEKYDVRDQRTVLMINLNLNGHKFKFSNYHRQRIETEELIDAKGPITILLYSMPVALEDNVTSRWTLMSPQSIESPTLKRVEDYGMVELWNSERRYLMYWNNFKELLQKDEIDYELIESVDEQEKTITDPEEFAKDLLAKHGDIFKRLSDK